MLEAGLAILKESGFEGFTLQEVSRRAGVSVGAIYSRAPSREALILAIHERAMADLDVKEDQLRSDSSRAGLSPRELVELLVSDLANVMLGEAEMLRVFMRQAPFNNEIWRHGSASATDASRIFSESLLAHRDKLGHPDPELAVDVAFRMVFCTISRRITHGDTFESARRISDEQLVAELSLAVADYLL